MDENFIKERVKKSNRDWKFFGFFAIFTAVLFLLVFGGSFFYASSYKEKVNPGIYIGSLSIGGMEKEELTRFLQDMSEKLTNEGLQFNFAYNGKKQDILIYPVVATEGTVVEFASLDIEKEVDRLITLGKSKNPIITGFNIFSGVFLQDKDLVLQNVYINEEALKQELADKFGEYETPAVDAGVDIISTDPLEYNLVSSTPGLEFAYEEALSEIRNSWSILQPAVVEIEQKTTNPKVDSKNLDQVLKSLPKIFALGSINLSYKDPQTGFSESWVLKKNIFKDWLEVQEKTEGEYAFGFDHDDLEIYLNSVVGNKIDREARDAKFEIEQNKEVKEFQGSRPGIKLNIEETSKLINEVIYQRASHNEGVGKNITVVVDLVEPSVSTGEANDLGITEILGIGVSDFSGSPSNRIKNIRNAVNKLNGILVKPGEEFSTIEHTQPYTLEGGYLPELVIKGDEIKPEIGGGLCQIGTTLFRMAMNSGLPITQRRNHSLVVGYYNDLQNGLPGTDATIYEPAPDFKFKNDTDNYILIQTEMDLANSRLNFILWGTSDGREGYYEKPIVKRWIPHGETKIIETTKLAPGERECQHAYTGAEAAFTYVRELPDGTKEEQVFESYYRPLPEICLVGVAELNKCQELPDGSTSCAPEEQNIFNPDGSIAIPEAEENT